MISIQKTKDNPYHYLTKMPIDSVSEENVEKLLNDKKNKEKQLSELESQKQLK